MNDTRLLVRAATALAGGASPPRDLPDPPIAAWAACVRATELLAVAEERGWRHAGEACRRELARRLDHLSRSLEGVRMELDEPAPARLATARDIYDDLIALQLEFPQLRVDLKAREITVATEPVTLEGVPLGAFEIVLNVARLDERFPYRVVALQPSCPLIDDTITHPHVRDDELCEGEAAAPLRRALRERRLLDFFTIVAQTLGTYNGASAYVRLDEWTGVTCRECGDHCDPDDASYCHRCSCDLCDDCGACCDACEQLCCHDCAGPCHACERSVCGACQRRCSTCRKGFCQECIHDGLCRECGEPADDAPADAEAAGEAHNAVLGTPHAEVHAHRMGEVGVLA
jgi:hypothetical protein